MKKFRSMLLIALSALLLLPSGALAAGGFEPPQQELVTSNGADGKEVIPVYGYIGKDGSIVDPDPTDPTVPPETEIYVEVPVKILFAAFEGDGGAVTSPDYTISNLSSVSDVKVEIDSFAQKNAAAADLGGQLELKLTDYTGADLVPGVFPASYPPSKLLKDVLPRKGAGGNVLQFRVGGHWSGGFNKELHPVFDMTLKFTALANPAN